MHESKRHQYLWVGVGLLALALELFLFYIAYWRHQYLVPPGNDVVAHYKHIEAILTSGNVSFTTYPSGFHLIVIGISRLFHLSIWSVLTNWTPVLVVLPSLAMFFLLRQIFSFKISVLTTTILLLSTGYPMYAFIDGNYPDMLAYGVFAVLLFAFLIRYFRTNQWLNLVWSGLFLVLIALTHHFTFFNVLIILMVFALVQVYQKIFASQMKFSLKAVWGIGLPLLLLGVGYVLASKLYGGMVLNFAHGLFVSSPSLQDTYLNTLLNYDEYPRFVGSLVWYFGLVGFIYLIATHLAKKEEVKSKYLLIIWLLFFYILSRLGQASVPARFARELALPLTFSMAFLWRYLLELNLNLSRLGRIFAYGLIGYLIIINSLIYTGLNPMPDTFISQIWYWPIDQSKADYLAANAPKDQPVLYNPAANLFFPVKSVNRLIPLILNADQLSLAQSYLDNPQNLQAKANHQDMITVLQMKYSDIVYLIDDVKPQGNTTSNTYPAYANYAEYKIVLESLAESGQLIQSFADSAAIYKMK